MTHLQIMLWLDSGRSVFHIVLKELAGDQDRAHGQHNEDANPSVGSARCDWFSGLSRPEE
jgi:hypothetical protein